MRLLPRSPAELQRVRRHIGGHAPRSIAEFRSPEQLTISMRRGVRLLRAVRLQAELREPPRQDSFCRAHLVEAGCQVPRQHLGPFRQAFRARQVGIPRGARLLHKAPHLFQFGLLILGQLPSANRTQADLGVRQALIDVAVLYCFCSSAVRTSPRTGGGGAGAGGVGGFGSGGGAGGGAAEQSPSSRPELAGWFAHLIRVFLLGAHSRWRCRTRGAGGLGGAAAGAEAGVAAG